VLTSYDDDDSGSSAIREVQLIPTESGFLTRSYQKCSGDFSAKALICLKPHPEFAQVGLAPDLIASWTSAPTAREYGLPLTVVRLTSRQNSGLTSGLATTSGFDIGKKPNPRPLAMAQ
jgi:hypothetical protein